MAEDIVIHSGDPGEVTPEESSAHEAAVAEGATAVHEQNAEQASSEAKAGAEVALASAAATIEAAESAGASAERAEAAAEQSAVTLEMMHQTLVAQGEAISALTKELKASRKTVPEPASDTGGQEHDEPPGDRQHWYLRKVGKNRES